MKKIISFGLGVLLLVPSLSLAQTATTTLTWSQRQSLIQILMQELQVLEQQIQQIIAQEQQSSQQVISVLPPGEGTAPVVPTASTSAASQVTPPPLQYPTPEILNMNNLDATFSPDNAQNGFTIGTFDLEYSGDWTATFHIDQQNVGSPITQTRASDGHSCFGYNCQFNGSDLQNLMVGLNYLPSPGTYTMTEHVYINGQDIQGSPMTFTFTVLPAQETLSQSIIQSGQQIQYQQNCINTAMANNPSGRTDRSQALASAIVQCGN